MKISVVGAGAMGSAVAADLVARDSVKQVQVCDSHSRLLQAIHHKVQAPKLRSVQVDARDLKVLGAILQGSDCVIACVPSQLNPNLARLCLDLGIHYCDLGGDDKSLSEILKLQDEAHSKGIWLVPNCGLAPGLVNVLSMHGIQQFDQVDTVQLRVGDIPLDPDPDFNFRLSWSAEKILNDYTNPVHIIQDGQLMEVDALCCTEQIHFDEPFGLMEAFCTAGGLMTISEDLAGKVQTLDYKTIRWPGHADQMRFLIGLGFADSRKIDARTHLTYRDVLIRRLKEKLGGSFEDVVLLRVLVHGIKEGQSRTVVFEMIEYGDKEHEISAIQRCTGIPAVAAACLIASKSVHGGGASSLEQVVPPESYLQLIHEQGLSIRTQWFDGKVDITDRCEIR